MSSSRPSKTPSSPDSCASPAGYSTSATPGASLSISVQPARPNGWSTRQAALRRPRTGPRLLGRYTHRIAIGDQRLCSLEDGAIRFRYTDYRRRGASRQKTMTLTATEFIRRMLLHVLPPGFHRIRYYGFLANRTRQQKLTECRRLLHAPPATIGRARRPCHNRLSGPLASVSQKTPSRVEVCERCAALLT